MKILIDGYDFTKYIYEIPVIEKNITTYGNAEEAIFNNTIDFNLNKKVLSFFDNGKSISKFVVSIFDDNNNFTYQGFIDSVKVTKNYITVSSISLTNILFSGYLKDRQGAYLKNNSCLIDVIKHILNIVEETIKDYYPSFSLTLDPVSYHTELNIENQHNLLFNILSDNTSYADIIKKICEISAGLFYLKGDKFIFETYNTNSKNSFYLSDEYIITYPDISNQQFYSDILYGVDIRFGADISYMEKIGMDSDKANKIIDISIKNEGLEISSNSLLVAEYLFNLHNDLLFRKTKTIELEIIKDLENIFKIGEYFTYNSVTYKITSVNYSSTLSLNIKGTAIL